MPARTPPHIEAEAVRQYTTRLPDGTWKGSKSIARELGITNTSVLTILRRNGIATRSLKEAHSGGKRSGRIKYPQRYGPSGGVCACGCGQSTPWSRKRNDWARYMPGHYRKDAPYKNPDWLRQEYHGRQRSTGEIAAECGVYPSTIARFMKKHGIQARDASASKVGRFEGERNPAWKGGISKWKYAPAWKRIARIIRKRDNYTCQMCYKQFEKQSKILHVHHIDGDKTNNSPDNLVAVCVACHPRGKRKEHYERIGDPHYRTKWLVTRKGEVLGLEADTYMTTPEVAKHFGVTTGHVIDMVKEGRLSGKKIGGFWYVERVSFEQAALTYKRGGHYR